MRALNLGSVASRKHPLLAEHDAMRSWASGKLEITRVRSVFFFTCWTCAMVIE